MQSLPYACAFACALSACAAVTPSREVRGPLTVSPRNALYFQDGNGDTIRFGGHQVFVDLQDHTFDKFLSFEGQAEFDWPRYLDFATQHDLNFVRSWTVWSTGVGRDDATRTAAPMMYERTGPGLARDGQPRFDLTRFNEAFFTRMRQRAQAAGERGIYMSVMLFEAYSFLGEDNELGEAMFRGNVFNGDNNVNGVDVDEDADGAGFEFFTTRDPEVRALQMAYVDKVVDTVEGLGNVLFEVANEVDAPEWQRSVIQHIHQREAGRDCPHLIYRSPGGRARDGGWHDTPLETLLASGAEVVGVSSAFGDFESDPPPAALGRPAIWDNDHIWGEDFTHRRRAWMAFTRGYHFVFYDEPFERPERDTPDYELMRLNIGATNRYAMKFADLAKMNPHGELTSTGFCLADPGQEYVIYAPMNKAFSVQLEPGTYEAEWFDCLTAQTHMAPRIEADLGLTHLTPPSAIQEDCALYLRRL